MSIFEDFLSSYSCCGRQLCFITPTCKEDEVKKENPQKFGISIYTILLYPLFQNRVDNLTNGVKLFAKNYSDWSVMTLNDILSRFDNLLEQEFRKAESQKKKIPVQWQTWWHRFIFNSFLLCFSAINRYSCKWETNERTTLESLWIETTIFLSYLLKCV